MKRFLLVVIATAAFTAPALSQGQHEAGLYADREGALVKLEHAPFSGVHSTSHVVKANSYSTFRGSDGQIRFQTKRPHFVFYGSTEGLSLVVVQLDKKSDSREVRIASGSILGGHGGFDPDKVTTVTMAKRSEGVWDISPNKDLQPGEYLLTPDASPRGYDFTIAP